MVAWGGLERGRPWGRGCEATPTDTMAESRRVSRCGKFLSVGRPIWKADRRHLRGTELQLTGQPTPASLHSKCMTAGMSVCSSVGRLVGRSLRSFVRSFARSLGRSVGRLVGWLVEIGLFVCWFVGIRQSGFRSVMSVGRSVFRLRRWDRWSVSRSNNRSTCVRPLSISSFDRSVSRSIGRSVGQSVG